MFGSPKQLLLSYSRQSASHGCAAQLPALHITQRYMRSPKGWPVQNGCVDKHLLLTITTTWIQDTFTDLTCFPPVFHYWDKCTLAFLFPFPFPHTYVCLHINICMLFICLLFSFLSSFFIKLWTDFLLYLPGIDLLLLCSSWTLPSTGTKHSASQILCNILFNLLQNSIINRVGLFERPQVQVIFHIHFINF